MKETTIQNATLIQSVEDPNTTYLCIGDKRYIFYEGKYAGFYHPELKKVI